MNKQNLRGVIVKIQDCLSDYDRQRLHFFLGKHVSRQIRDDLTPNGTLRLMESLFDQDKIGPHDVTLLIEAFYVIESGKAVKILKEYMKQIQSNELHQSTQNLSSTVPSFIDQILSDQDDKNSTHSFFLNPINNCSKNSTVITSNNTNINPLTITIDNKKMFSSSRKQNQQSNTSFITNKYVVLAFLLFFITIGILAGILVMILKEMNQLKNTVNQQNATIAGQQNNNSRLIQQLERTQTNNTKLIELINTMNKSANIRGKKFGGDYGYFFDDSSYPKFTYHYLNGFAIYSENESMPSYQFLYSSVCHNENPIKTIIYGDQESLYRGTFELDKDVRIYKVEGQIINETIAFPNGTTQIVSRITGLQFFLTNNVVSPSYNGRFGQKFTEQFDGYFIGYVTGRSSEYIHQLQFFWYRSFNQYN